MIIKNTNFYTWPIILNLYKKPREIKQNCCNSYKIKKLEATDKKT